MLALAAAGAVFVLVACASSAGPSDRDVRGTIVFSRDGSLYLIEADGSGLELLARNAVSPKPSPDGRTIAFVRGGAIWVMERDGSGQRLLVDPPASDPAWAPDGMLLYLVRYGQTPEDESSITSVRAVDATRERRLVTGCPATPAPSPDGSKVAYASFADCKHGWSGMLSAVSPLGKPVSLGFDLPSDARDPAWSPAGDGIAYTSIVDDFDMGESSYAIFFSASDGSSARAVAPLDPPDLSAHFEDPSWSPDAAWLALVRTTWDMEDDDADIWLVRPDGSDLHPLTEDGATDDGNPAWLPVTPR